MTDEERAKLVDRLRGLKSVRYTHLLEATGQIVADGQRIAELEASVTGLTQERDFHRQTADLHAERIAELEARLAHAEDDCNDDCIYCEEWRKSFKGGVSDLGVGTASPTTKLEVISRAALGDKQ